MLLQALKDCEIAMKESSPHCQVLKASGVTENLNIGGRFRAATHSFRCCAGEGVASIAATAFAPRGASWRARIMLTPCLFSQLVQDGCAARMLRARFCPSKRLCKVRSWLGSVSSLLTVSSTAAATIWQLHTQGCWMRCSEHLGSISKTPTKAMTLC